MGKVIFLWERAYRLGPTPENLLPQKEKPSTNLSTQWAFPKWNQKPSPHTWTPFDGLQQLFKPEGVFTRIGYVEKAILVLVFLVDGAH